MASLGGFKNSFAVRRNSFSNINLSPERLTHKECSTANNAAIEKVDIDTTVATSFPKHMFAWLPEFTSWNTNYSIPTDHSDLDEILEEINSSVCCDKASPKSVASIPSIGLEQNANLFTLTPVLKPTFPSGKTESGTKGNDNFSSILKRSGGRTKTLINRKLTFHRRVRVLLIPCLSEYTMCGSDLRSECWWQPIEYMQMKKDALNELSTCMKWGCCNQCGWLLHHVPSETDSMMSIDEQHKIERAKNNVCVCLHPTIIHPKNVQQGIQLLYQLNNSI